MPFDDKYNLVYENTIKPAIKEMNLEVKRGDDIFGTAEVIRDIWKYINKARFLIAVLNDKNPNVFYEVGISHAIGKKVIFISNKEEDVPFDLRHLRRIVYEDTKIEQLKRSLMETIGEIKKEEPASEISYNDRETLELILKSTVESLYREQLKNDIKYRAY